MYPYLTDQLHTAVKLFSARANSRALFRIVVNQSNPNVIECLHGIRCMSLFWVVWIHQYDNVFSAPNINRFRFLSVSTISFFQINILYIF